MTLAIKVENLSKAYQIGQIGTGTISRDIERWFITRILGRDDPFIRLGERNDRTRKSKSNVVWSLRDIDLQIHQGDAVGIVGRNGAGKSTLLKLLSRVTSPTTGNIKIKGRVASLLEVGTGFHPELTGRENIYLNGSILGMRKREIDRKLDEIIDFSGVERYIDTPVKRYSSGMSVRLAFAVAAHLESEILIVDEVLAVGDAEFQKKCLGKMEEVGQRDGRTVLFVSHNMSAIQSLCSRGILLESGDLSFDGSAVHCISEYYQANKERSPEANSTRQSVFDVLGFTINDSLHPTIKVDGRLAVELRFRALGLRRAEAILILENVNSQQIIHSRVNLGEIGPQPLDGRFALKVDVPCLWLTPGVYCAYFKLLEPSLNSRGIMSSERVLVEVRGELDRTGRTILSPDTEWSLTEILPEQVRVAGGLSAARVRKG
jgi:lipopolysaccharide transport system ATP-binding protein